MRDSGLDFGLDVGFEFRDSGLGFGLDAGFGMRVSGCGFGIVVSYGMDKLSVFIYLHIVIPQKSKYCMESMEKILDF